MSGLKSDILESDLIRGLELHPVNSFVWCIDREDLGESVLLYANKAARRVDPLMENVGCRAIDKFPSVFENEENAFEYSRQSLESGQPRRLVEVVYGDESLGQASTHYESKIFPIDDDHVLVQFDIIDDEAVINRNDRLVKELRARNLELERSNAELERFAQMASHDLQEPLRTMTTLVGMVAGEFGDALGEEGRDWLNRVANAASRQRTMIRSLLSYSTLSRDLCETEEVALSELANEVVDDLSDAIERSRATIEVKDLPTVTGDRIQLRQLLHNLLANSLKFHREGVAPKIRVYQRPGSKGFVVEDNGIGIESDMRGEVLRPLRRLHDRRRYEGTGIGLAICQRVVELHGGSLQIESVEPHGTRVCVSLSEAPQGVSKQAA